MPAASSVILLGEGAVKLPDEDRKTQLQAALILLLGMNNVLPKTAPGQAPLHVAFVNTYLALGPNQKQVRACRPICSTCAGTCNTLLMGLCAGLGQINQERVRAGSMQPMHHYLLHV